MPRKIISAADILAGVVLAAFRKVLWTVITVAFLASAFATSIFILIYSLVK
jgi:hypothetical protein